jgi:hypothetical protein
VHKMISKKKQKTSSSLVIRMFKSFNQEVQALQLEVHAIQSGSFKPYN